MFITEKTPLCTGHLQNMAPYVLKHRGSPSPKTPVMSCGDVNPHGRFIQNNPVCIVECDADLDLYFYQELVSKALMAGFTPEALDFTDRMHVISSKL